MREGVGDGVSCVESARDEATCRFFEYMQDLRFEERVVGWFEGYTLNHIVQCCRAYMVQGCNHMVQGCNHMAQVCRVHSSGEWTCSFLECMPRACTAIALGRTMTEPVVGFGD